MASVKLTYTDPETGSSASTTFTNVLVVRGWYEFDDMELFPGIQHRYLSGSINEQIAGFRRKITIDFGVVSSFASRKAILYFLKDSARTINLVMAAPANLAGSATSGGSLDNDGVYYWRVTAVDGVGETTGAIENTETIASAPSTDRSISLTWDAVSGATSYRIYRTQVSGDYSGEAHFVAESTTNSYTDTGTALTTTYVLPTVQALSVALVNPGGYQNEWLNQVQLGRRYVCELYDQTLRTTLTP